MVRTGLNHSSLLRTVLVISTAILLVLVFIRSRNPRTINLPERRGEWLRSFSIPRYPSPAERDRLRKMLEEAGRLLAEGEVSWEEYLTPINPLWLEVSPDEQDQAEQILSRGGAKIKLYLPKDELIDRRERALLNGYRLVYETGQPSASIVPLIDIVSDLAFFRLSFRRDPQTVDELLAGVYPVDELARLSPRERVVIFAPYIDPTNGTPLNPLTPESGPLYLKRVEGISGGELEELIKLLRLSPPPTPEGFIPPPAIISLYHATLWRGEKVLFSWLIPQYGARGDSSQE